MKVTDYLWNNIDNGDVDMEIQIESAEILDGFYGRRRAFGSLDDPNRDAIQKLQAWASHVASTDSAPHKIRLRAARLALSR